MLQQLSSSLKQVTSRLTALETVAAKILSNVGEEDLDMESLDTVLKARIDSEEAFEEFEVALGEDEGKRKKLVLILASMEKGVPGKVARAMMRAVMTNGIMSNFSATGQKGGKRPFKDTILCSVILKALRKCIKNGKRSDFFFEISEVLRNAPNMPGGSNYVRKKSQVAQKRNTQVYESEAESDE
ncbi:putative DNA topoisomerase 2-alpha-like isoform X2 [Apostichopus japonicus]|uniref:Putative DNA topoisomerase 2-alpha-like isoform X2 n=1 Tax=Stichopus japonicus TaxID=307972 RepID=A0A2G8KBE1_STIJA|nr:putative DNA topoisomerase 2-alpha-like isoform X2 [Apostichopus japonicus]